EIVELRRVPALARVEGKAEDTVMKQALSGCINQRGYHRQLVLLQLETEIVLLDDLLVAPTVRTVKLGDERRAVFDPHLIDTVLVTVESEGAAIASEPQAFHGIHDKAWRKGLKRVRRFRHSNRPYCFLMMLKIVDTIPLKID